MRPSIKSIVDTSHKEFEYEFGWMLFSINKGKDGPGSVVLHFGETAFLPEFHKLFHRTSCEDHKVIAVSLYASPHWKPMIAELGKAMAAANIDYACVDGSTEDDVKRLFMAKNPRAELPDFSKIPRYTL